VPYRTVAEHWQAFLERAEEHDGAPRFVVKESRSTCAAGVSSAAASTSCVVMSAFMGEVDHSLLW